MDKNNQKNKYQDYFDNDKYSENNYYQDQKGGVQDQEKNQGYFSKIEKDRKIALGFLVAFSVVIIVIFFINLNNTINDPFVIRDPNRPNRASETNNQNVDQVCVGPNCPQEPEGLVRENLDLKMVDTDGDGLSDWDELFLYGTSPYLEDTSGDGISDYDSIFVYKIDPVCPPGEECPTNLNIDGSLQVDQLINNPAASTNVADPSIIENTVFQNSTLQENLITELQQMSPDQIREGLLNSGVDQTSLDLLSDEEIIAIYQESLENFDFSQIQ